MQSERPSRSKAIPSTKWERLPILWCPKNKLLFFGKSLRKKQQLTAPAPLWTPRSPEHVLGINIHQISDEFSDRFSVLIMPHFSSSRDGYRKKKKKTHTSEEDDTVQSKAAAVRLAAAQWPAVDLNVTHTEMTWRTHTHTHSLRASCALAEFVQRQLLKRNSNNLT